ncbi:MAG: hypothetical protein WBQ53_15760 [Methylocystis sp.]
MNPGRGFQIQATLEPYLRPDAKDVVIIWPSELKELELRGEYLIYPS